MKTSLDLVLQSLCHNLDKHNFDYIFFADNILELPEGTKIQVLAPVIRGKKGEYVKLLGDFQKDGFVRAIILTIYFFTYTYRINCN